MGLGFDFDAASQLEVNPKQRGLAGLGSRDGASLSMRKCHSWRQQTRWGPLRKVLVLAMRAGVGRVCEVGLLWVLIVQLLATVIDYIGGDDGSGCDGGG